MADGEFDVVLAIIPEGQDEAAAKTNVLTEAVKQGGEAARGATAAADQLSAADQRRVEALAATVQAMQRQMAATAEVQRQQIVLAQQVQQATGASAVEMARANQVAANVAGLQERTAIMRAQLEIALQGPAAERAWAEAEALRAQVAATGAAPGTAGAAAAEAELVAQRQLQTQLAAVALARERDAEAASVEAAAQLRLLETLSALRGQNVGLTERIAAERQGAAAVALYNEQLAVKNALLRAGVAEIGAQGQLVVLDREGAAAIEAEVVAQARLNAELAAMAPEVEAGPGKLAAMGERMILRMVLLAAIMGTIRLGKDVVEDALAFESAMTRLNTLVGVAKEQTDGWRQSIRDIAKDVGVGPTELAKAMFAITSDGLRGAAALDTLKASAQASAIGLGDTTTIARAAVSAVQAYGEQNLTSAHAIDILIGVAREGNVAVDTLAGAFGRVLSVAHAAGVSFDQAGAFVASFTRQGVSADEAVTALRAAIVNLELKTPKGGESALKQYGSSLAEVRAEIKEKGLAVALVDLINLFKGNNDALEKVLPNIRGLVGVLAVASEGSEKFLQIQKNVADSIGHGLADALAIWEKTPEAALKRFHATLADIGLEIGEKMLPALVAAAQDVQAFLSTLDPARVAEWGSAAGSAIKGVVDVLTFAAEHADLLRIAFGTLLVLKVAEWVEKIVLSLRGLLALSNPLLALIAAMVLGLNEVVKLWRSWDQEVINSTNSLQGFKGAFDSARLALGDFQTSGVVTRDAVAQINAGVAGLGETIEGLKAKLLQAQGTQVSEAFKIWHKAPNAVIAETTAALKDAEAHLALLKGLQDKIVAGLQSGRLQIEAAAKAPISPAGGVEAGPESPSKAAQNARFEIEKTIAARELAARSAVVLAAAELQGAEAVRQASIAAQADTLIQADRERAKKAGIEVTALEEQRIRASTAALSDANQIARLNQQIFASGEADRTAAVANEAKLADARARNTLASQLAAAQLQVENAALKNGIPLADTRVQQLVKEAQARVLANQQTDIAVANAKRDFDFAVAQRQAQADLADAQNQNRDASTALSDQLDIENQVAAAGIALDQKAIDKLAAQVIGRKVLADVEKTTIVQTKELQAQYLALDRALAKFTDDQSFRRAIQEWGQGAADILQKYGLLSDATQALEIHQTALAAATVKGETRKSEEIERQLTLQQKVRNEQALGFAQIEIHQAEVAKLYGTVAAVFDQISIAAGGSATKLGQVTAAISGLVQALEKVKLSGKAWSAEWAGAVAGVASQVGALFKSLDLGGANKTGGAQALGGKLDSNYAGVGSIVGTILGAVLAAVFSWGIGTAGGAALGGAIGTVIGSLISKAGDSASAALLSGGNIVVGETSTQLNGAVRDALLNIFKGINTELAKLGLQLDGIPLIDIKVRDNVIRVLVGAVVRTFSSMQDAISFGISEALRQSQSIGAGLPQEVAQALKNSTATDLAALESDIQFAQGIANYGVPTVVQAINKSVSDFYVAMQRAAQLGIESTKVLAQFRDQIQAQKDQILGINRAKSPEDQLRADVAAFNEREKLLEAEQKLNVANLLIKRSDLEQQIQIEKASWLLVIAHGQAAKARLQIDAEAEKAHFELLASLAQAIAAVDAAILTSQALIDSIVLISDEELNAALARLRNVGRGGGAPSGPSPAEQLNTELEKLARTNLPASVNAVIDLGLQLADLTRRTRDAHASEVLLAQARQALIDQAKAQILDPVRGSLLPGQGGTYGQTQLQQAAAAADKAFADADAAQRKLLETTGQRAIAFWQLQDAHLRALNALAEQDIASLGLPMEATRKKVADLRDSLGFLWEMFGRGALSAERFVEVLAQLQQQSGNELLGLAQTLLSTIGDTDEAAKVKHALDVASFELQRLQINYLYQQYKALGLVSAAVQAILDEALAKINAFDSSKVGAVAATQAGATPGSDGLTPAEYAAAVAADKARYLGTISGAAGTGLTEAQALQGLAQYELAQQSQLAQQIAKVTADFASYRAVLGDTLQVQRDYALALRSVIVTALQPLQTFLDGLNTSQFSPLKALDQLAASQQTFEKAIAAVRGGDFTHLGDLTGYAQAYLQQALSSLPVGSDEYKRIEARVEAEIRAILAQYGGNPVAPPSGGPGAPPPGGSPPPPPPTVNVQPVVDAVHTTAADQLVELKEITRNTRETQQEVYALRRRLDDPITVFERVS